MLTIIQLVDFIDREIAANKDALERMPLDNDPKTYNVAITTLRHIRNYIDSNTNIDFPPQHMICVSSTWDDVN